MKAKKGDINLRHAISADYCELVSYLEGIKQSSAKAPKGLKISTLAYAWDVHVDTPRQAYLTTENGSSRYFQPKATANYRMTSAVGVQRTRYLNGYTGWMVSVRIQNGSFRC